MSAHLIPIEDAAMEVVEGRDSIGIVLPWWLIAKSPLIRTYMQECGCREDFKRRPFRVLLNGAQIADSPPLKIRVDVGDVVTQLCRCGAPLKLEDIGD